jgi:hypothetical protein
VFGLEAAAVARQRARAVRALPGGVGVDVEKHHAVAGERVAHALGHERAAGDRQHRRRRSVEQLAGQLLLGLAERALAVRGEPVVDRGAQALLEGRAGVDRAAAERGRGGAGGRGLARPHETDEDEHPALGRRYGRRRFHPMRSSYAASAARTSSMWSPPNLSR